MGGFERGWMAGLPLGEGWRIIKYGYRQLGFQNFNLFIYFFFFRRREFSFDFFECSRGGTVPAFDFLVFFSFFFPRVLIEPHIHYFAYILSLGYHICRKASILMMIIMKSCSGDI